MNSCERHSLRLMLHLDGELDVGEQRLVRAHLETCGACRNAFRRERLFRKGIRRRRPLYAAPDALRARVASLVDTRRAMPPAAEARRASGRAPSSAAGHLRAVSGVALLAVVVGLIGIRTISDAVVAPAGAASFPAMATDVHQRHQRGELPLEVVTDTAADIARWFAGKVPFIVTLPDYQEISGQNVRYEIRGARLVGFDGGYAAYVAYRMERQPISLVITSASVARPTGGETIPAKGIDFHFETIDGLKVVTWSHRDLTYALVSNLEERGQQSCMVCHQGTTDGDLLDSLAFPDGARGAMVLAERPERRASAD